MNMCKQRIGNTSFFVALVALVLGCGASASEIRVAQRSGYRADFAVVFSEAVAAVRQLYPNVNDDPSTGTIKTAWHQVRLGTGGDRVGRTQGSGGSLTGSLQDFYFVRFDVHVVGGEPWRVKVEGVASKLTTGEVPQELRGGDQPEWLKGRTEALQLAIHKRLEEHAVVVKVAETAAPRTGVDPARFGALPAPAAATVAAVYDAARSRDYKRLRQRLAADFTWSLGAAGSADTAIIMWKADDTLLAALIQTLDQACVPDRPDYVRCPGTGSHPWRATFAPAAAGDWQMTSFVAVE